MRVELPVEDKKSREKIFVSVGDSNIFFLCSENTYNGLSGSLDDVSASKNLHTNASRNNQHFHQSLFQT